MCATPYIGSNYASHFAEFAEWGSTRAYEPLTIVLYNGDSYVSKQYVPTDIDISNEDYWTITSHFSER